MLLESIENILYNGRKFLKENDVESYNIDARIILQTLLNISHEELISKYGKSLSIEEIDLYHKLLEERIKGRPISQITGYKEFYSRNFKVDKHVLTPRSETEIIIDHAKKLFSIDDNLKILDLGTGSGCIAISLALEFINSSLVATDISIDAIKVATSNIDRFGLTNKINIIESDWLGDISEKNFDLIVSNPPYIKNNSNLQKDVIDFEPHIALFGGDDGLMHYRSIAKNSKKFIKNNGYLILEFGIGQEDDISSIFRSEGMNIEEIIKDIYGINRIIVIKNIIP